MSAERTEINSSSLSTRGSQRGLGTGREPPPVCRQTDGQATMARDLTRLSHNTSLQAPRWAQAPSPGSAQGAVEVILRLFPCSYLSRPRPTNSQTEKQTGQWPGPFSRRGRPAPSPTPRVFLTKFLHTEPLRLCSSHPKGITLQSILKAGPPPRSPIAFSSSISQQCSGRALNRMGLSLAR